MVSSEDIRRIRKTLHRTVLAMAKIVGASENTWQRWETGKATPQPHFREKLEKLLAHIDGRKGRG